MASAPFNLNDIVDDVVARVTSPSSHGPGEPPISVSGDGSVALVGDEAGLRQILMEFIDVGRSCVSTGAVAIDLDLCRPSEVDQSSLTLRCRVRGSGKELTCDEASTILTTFLSGGGSATRTPGRELIDRMGAGVAVERIPGKGFSVSFSAVFGIKRAGGAAPDRAGTRFPRFRDPEMSMPDGLDRLRGRCVLLAEDNPVNQNLTREILVQAGCGAEIAEDGRATVDAVRRRGDSFDAILMDVQMPIMDGYEATRLIRTELGRSDLPIIAMTANVLCDERERCLAAGMNDYVAKPFHIPDLYAILIRWMAPCDPHPEYAGDATALAGVAPALADTNETSLPDAIPEIDISKGLARAMGNRELYAGLLAQFAATNRTAGIEVAAAIANGDRERARFLVHGISSSAGNLGAQDLYEAARGLECALVEGGDVEKLLATFQVRLQRVVSGIRETGAELNGRQVRLGDGQRPLDPDEASHAAATLSTMLDDQDMAARHHAERMLEIFGGRGRDEQLRSLMTRLEALEFAEAKEILAGICEDILK